MCHYRLGHFELVENMISSIRQSFNTNELNNKVIELILVFLRKGARAMNFGINEVYSEAIQKLIKLEKDQFEKVAFIYYNYTDWFESLLQNTSMEKSINNRTKN